MAAVNDIVASPTEEGVRELEAALLSKTGDTYSKHEYPRYVARALLTLGVRGVQMLADLLPRAPGHIYPLAILRALYEASHGRVARLLGIFRTGSELEPAISSDTKLAAEAAFRDVVLQARESPELVLLLAALLQETAIETTTRGTGTEALGVILEIAADAGLAISPRTIAEFEGVVREDASEESIQRYISAHPQILDALALEIIPKQMLGADLVTDYVVRRKDGHYIVVEIERPSTPIFTRNGEFTAQFTHAYGQILGFQAWVADNIAYAQKLLPGMSAPAGLLVIGLRTALSESQERRLQFWNGMHRHYARTVCFDDLSAEARTLYENLRRPQSHIGAGAGPASGDSRGSRPTERT